MKVYKDYRKNIPTLASSSLAFYMMFLLIPAVTLLAIGTSFFNIDLTLFERLLKIYINSEYVVMIISILHSNNVNSTALMTIAISLFSVSRGIGNIYRISKNMFNTYEDENIIEYYIYSIKVTILLLILYLIFFAVIALKPLSALFHVLYAIIGIRHILLYFIIVYFLAVIYKLVPRIKISYRDAIKGAMISGALMLILFYAIQIYFGFTDFNSVYGPLASIVAVLFVFYWSAEVFFVGMYCTYLFYLRRLVG